MTDYLAISREAAAFEEVLQERRLAERAQLAALDPAPPGTAHQITVLDLMIAGHESMVRWWLTDYPAFALELDGRGGR